MFTVLRASRPVRVLYIARGISEIGNWCANIALPMLIYEVTHDVSATALMVCCRFAPSLFSVALAQLPQKMGIGTLQAMRLADLIRAGLFVCYIFVDSKWSMFAITCAVSLCRTVEMPCFYSLLRANTNSINRDVINNSFGFLQNLMMVLGPVAGGFVVAQFGAEAVLALDALSFAASFWLLRDVPSVIEVNDKEGISKNEKNRTAFSDLSAEHLAIGFLLIDISSGVAFGSLNSLLPAIAQLQFDSSSIQYGFLQSSLTIGLLFGNTIYGRLISGSDCVKSYCFVTYLALGAYLAFGYRYASGISFIFLFIVGAGNAIQDVLLITSLQDLARDGSESISLFSIRESLQSVAVVISTIELIQKSALNVDEAKDIFRSKRYFNLKERQYAENIFRNALYIINHVSYGVKYTFNSIDLPYDYYSTPEIMKSLADTLHNPFISFYETAFLKRIQREKIEFIGISVSGCFQLISAVTLAKLIKEECPSVKHVSLGGNYITRLADDCMKEWHPFFEYIDSIMMYDGEEPLARLLEALDSGDDNLDCVPNLCHAKGGKIYKNHRIEQTFINDTVPDFDGFALSKYFMPELILPVYSSRQCFNHCAFCTIPGATGGCYRKMPISRVFEIMCRLNEKYGTRVFSFVDETFEGKRMEQLADEINASGKTFFWHGETRFSPTLSTDVFNKIYQSGCRQIQFGLESYNQRVLDLMKKNTRVDWIDRNIHDCLNAGIPVHLFFMIGFPTETKEEALNTLAYTENVLNYSKQVCGVPYSTRGFTNFGLVMGSDVWNHPDKYGVSVMPKSQYEDLRLEVDYVSGTGLTLNEAKSLSDEHHIDFYMQEVINGSDTIDLPQRLHISEVTWILDSIHAVRYKGHLTKVKRRLTSLNPADRIWLDSKTSVVLVEPFAYFYNSEYHHVYAVSQLVYLKLARLVEADCSISLILDQGDLELTRAIEELLHYGLLNTNIDADYVMHDNGFQLVKSSFVKEVGRSKEGLRVLLSCATHRMCAVNDYSFALLSLFEKPITKNELRDILKKEGLSANEEQLNKLVDNCMKADILQLIR